MYISPKFTILYSLIGYLLISGSHVRILYRPFEKADFNNVVTKKLFSAIEVSNNLLLIKF